MSCYLGVVGENIDNTPSYLCSELHSDIFWYRFSVRPVDGDWCLPSFADHLTCSSLYSDFFPLLPAGIRTSPFLLQHPAQLGHTLLHLRSLPCGTLFFLPCDNPVCVTTRITKKAKSLAGRSYSDQEGLPNASFLFNAHKTATKKGFVPISNLLIIADSAKARRCTPPAGFTSAAG